MFWIFEILYSNRLFQLLIFLSKFCYQISSSVPSYFLNIMDTAVNIKMKYIRSIKLTKAKRRETLLLQHFCLLFKMWHHRYLRKVYCSRHISLQKSTSTRVSTSSRHQARQAGWKGRRAGSTEYWCAHFNCQYFCCCL
jgi:hypothetical protein